MCVTPNVRKKKDTYEMSEWKDTTKDPTTRHQPSEVTWWEDNKCRNTPGEGVIWTQTDILTRVVFTIVIRFTTQYFLFWNQ